MGISLKTLLGLWALQVQRRAFECYFWKYGVLFHELISCLLEKIWRLHSLCIHIENKDLPNNGRPFQNAGIKLWKQQI